jgi:hypothetical protein
MAECQVMFVTVRKDRAGRTPEERQAAAAGDWKMAERCRPTYLAPVVDGEVRAVYEAGPTYAVGNGRRAFAWLRPVPPDDPVTLALLGKPHPRPGRNPVRYVTITG